MSLSVSDLNLARIAYRQNKYCRASVAYWNVFVFLLLAVTNLLVYRSESRPTEKGLVALAFALLAAFEIARYQWFRKPRFRMNRELLEAMQKQEPHLYDILDRPEEEHPLLESWNRRLEKRALLWRVDRFLSGKGWRETQ
jgi:hypothetical protein